MACRYCKGSYKWVATEKLNTDLDPAPIVKAFMCKDCGRFTFWDKAKSNYKKSGYKRREIPKIQKRQPQPTEDEKIFYAILQRWSMTPKEIRKYINKFKLNNKIALIVGGGLIGGEVTKAFLEAGAKVILLDCFNSKVLE